MERNSPAAKEHDHKHNFRAGLKGKAGKLFGKDKKLSTENNDVSDFLYGPSDKLQMTTPTPTSPIGSQLPPIVRVDTANARRWPSATEITGSNRGRGRSASPRRNRKGLAVQFTTAQPEVIGIGGDESEEPTVAISSRKRANSHPQRLPSQQPPPLESRQIFQAGYGANHSNTQGPPYPDAFTPGPLQRTQTGYESIEGTDNRPPHDNMHFQMPLQRTQTGYESIEGTDNRPPHDNMHFQMPSGGVPDESLHNGFIKSEPNDPNSFAAKIQAEMRRDEGEALTRAASTLLDPQSLEDISADPTSGSGLTPGMEQLQINTLRNSHISDSSSSTNFPSQVMSELRPQTPDSYISPVSPEKPEPDPTLSRSSTFTLQQAAVAVGDEALQDFSRRMAHLFTLFRLSTESVKPISTCSLMEVTRAAAWWFLKGRMNLEATVRDRPSSPEAQQYNFIKRQQAHADLAKALWLLDHVTPQLSNAASQQGIGSADMADISDTRQAIMTNLRKLTMSMKRNNFMPLDPDEAPLQQGLDPSIWVRDEGNRSLVSNQKNAFTMSISDGLPLGDTSRIFSYSRMFAEAILMEEDESQQYRCPALVSVVRGQKEKKLRMVITSANGIIQLCVQSDRSQGPIWEDVAWRAQNSAVDIKLPRGFFLRLQCSQQDFRALYGIYDYQNKIHASLFEHQDEVVAFEATVKAFQHFDQNPQSQIFPKEAVTSCQVRIFERLITEKAATGARKLHRGFRIAIVTGSKTRNLSGINQDIPPNLPVQFGFLRGEGGFPSFLLKFEDGSTKSTMVFTFNDVYERMQMHTRLAGTALADGESIVAEAQVKAFEMVNAVNDARFSRFLKPVEWQSIRVINEDEGDLQSNKTVLSQHLRVVMDFKAGSITDRLSVEPGELKLRLDVNTANELKVLRQKQQDMTISISEAQVPKELIHDAAHLLRAINESETSRIYSFPSLKELHLFQAALTGFQVLYDGFSASFNISRRRMVVPIYKKWDAEKTRLQIVQKEKVIQLVAFFENFSHGDCMNFALKGTDVYENSTRSGKFQLKIVDAKFPMPKTKPEGKEAKGEGEHSDTGMESSFVSLDMPEYPGEHDDITIVFDTEAERERFSQALPAPVKIASRIGSIRK